MTFHKNKKMLGEGNSARSRNIIYSLDLQEPKKQKKRHVAEGEAKEKHQSNFSCKSSTNEVNKSDETDISDDDKAPKDLQNGAANREKQPIKMNVCTCQEDRKIVIELNCMDENHNDGDKQTFNENIVVKSKLNPKISEGNEGWGKDSKFKKQVCPQGQHSLKINDNRNSVASTPIERESRRLVPGCASEVVNKKTDATVSSCLFDGLWEMSWKSYPMDSTIVSIQENSFEMFEFPCKIKLGGPEENYNPSFKWPLEITSNTNPIFQMSELIIPPGMERKELPIHIEWTTTDSSYGKITWKKLDNTDPESHVPEEALTLRKEQEESGMLSTITGKAWILVEDAVSLQTEDIKIIAQDDIMILTERLLNAQADFKRRNLPIYVDIAYHHTRGENLTTIKTDGLLSRMEREQQCIVSKYNGSCYGDGIYCTLDPSRHAHRYGDTTILLARMKGIDVVDRSGGIAYNTLNVDSGGFCVLQSSSQCVPLFQFPSKLLAANFESGGHISDFLERLADFQKKVQALIDKIFNENVSAEGNSTQAIMHNKMPSDPIWCQNLAEWKHSQPQGDLRKKLEMQRQQIKRQARINLEKKKKISTRINTSTQRTAVGGDAPLSVPCAQQGNPRASKGPTRDHDGN